jgi:hypothetical protein
MSQVAFLTLICAGTGALLALVCPDVVAACASKYMVWLSDC